MSIDQEISILIIEDNPGDQLLLEENLLSTTLNITGIKIVETLSEGVASLGKNNYSLIFLDLFLPDSSGLNSLTELVKINPRIPIIIYSGLSDTRVALNAITSGAQDFLIKGDYTISLLEKAIRYSIERKHSSDALEASNERYNLVSKATHDMIWDWDLVTDKIYRNSDGWNKIFKTKDDGEGTRQDWLARIHPEDRERADTAINVLIKSETEEFIEMEFRIIRDDGTTGVIEDRGFLIRNPKGNVIRIIGASHDITDRKKAEHDLLMSEQRFKSLVQNGSDLLAILDESGNYTYVSPTSKTILGFEPAYFTGKSAFDFIHPDDIQEIEQNLLRAATEKFIPVPLFRFKNSEGKWRWIESTITNLMDDPAVRGIVVNSRDVTDKKNADDEIKKLSLVAKETINGVIISDKDHNIVWVNHAFTKLCGYELEEVIGKNPMDVLTGPQVDMDVVNYVNVQNKLAVPFVFEIINYTKSKQTVLVRVQVQPLFDKNGNVEQFFSLQTDITKERELENNIELEKIIRQKEVTDAVFASQESERSEIGRELHDNVNQLLGATKLYIDMAKTDEVSRELLLTNASTFTLNAIEEIRKLSKTLITPLIKEIGLADSIKDLTEEIMLVHPVRILYMPGEFNETGLSDKFKLNVFRIIQEQINNSLKHARAKTITISIRETDKYLFVAVSDDGIGFDTAKRKNGVGLTNIKSRCELYNGTVLLTSEAGKGTALSVTFHTADLLTDNL